MALARCKTGMFRAALRANSASVVAPSLRFNSTAAAAESSSAAAAASSSSDSTPASARRTALPLTQSLTEEAQKLAAEHGLTPVQYSYFVPRVGRLADNLPVYTDVRNAGSRVMTEVRRIEGNLADLRSDLEEHLAHTYDSNKPSYIAAQATLEARALAAERNATEPHIPYLPHNGRTPNRIKVIRKSISKRGHPTAIDPVQPSVVIQSGKLKIRGNRVRQIKEFLEARGF